MPPIFKALVTISVWLLFLTGCMGVIITGIVMLSAMTAGKTLMEGLVSCAATSFAFILACVGAWLRKKLE